MKTKLYFAGGYLGTIDMREIAQSHALFVKTLAQRKGASYQVVSRHPCESVKTVSELINKADVRLKSCDVVVVVCGENLKFDYETYTLVEALYAIAHHKKQVLLFHPVAYVPPYTNKLGATLHKVFPYESLQHLFEMLDMFASEHMASRRPGRAKVTRESTLD